MKDSSSAKTATGRLSDRIKVARLRAKLTQAQIAASCGVSPSAVAQWESTNGTRPKLQRIRLIAAATDSPFEWLATADGPSFHSGDRGSLEAAAVTEEAFAQDIVEERLLREFRAIGPRARELVALLVSEMAGLKRNVLKRRA